MDNKNLTNGSTALAPKYKPYEPRINEELKRQEKEKREKQRALAHQKAVARAKVLGIIVFAFIMGLVLIGRYAAVYNLQKELTKVKSDINNFTMENENLKVQLIKASNMLQIEQAAKTKLNMITPDKNMILYTKATKDYFAKDTKEDNKSTQEDLLAKIKNLLF
jgi:cell division protein FtsL